jgi:hypothetical protein
MLDQQVTAHAEPAVAEAEHPFTPGELTQFDDDDSTAGRAICRMLTLFFFYTVMVMGLSGLWTYFAVFGSDAGADKPAAHSSGH